ncbi:hypothetical protein EDD37DRAFT_684009 [Exophiala viscosa]|uniref:uncharacterized protein n=1 Tax=Exophiala viscosa TaxID=2486360 RepID=UPI0021A18329|nr:hypothetical protein EDD37DRAFT_684009 [Exophiala viscosa]
MANSIPFTDVQIKSDFWDDIIKVSRKQSLEIIHQKLRSYGQWDAMRLTWKPGDNGVTPDILWDSDVGKYVEAASYALYHEENPEMRDRVDEGIDMIIKAQQDDGYIGIYHTLVQPGRRWSSLAHNLELYGGGHILEAAITHHLTSGQPNDDKFLAAMQSYVELLQKVFGEDKLLDYPGHQEIELALMRLYDITGDQRLVDLAKFFIEERGRTDAPREGHAWDIAALRRGDDPKTFFPYYWPRPRCYWHMQAHLPIREQHEIVGHSVQAMYWLSSVVDVALAAGDTSYLEVVDRLWSNMVDRKMYVTGGIGSVHIYEGFGPEYDLPNETSYAETCAAIGVMYLAQRKLKVKAEAAVADILELSMYNAMLAGLSLDGKSFNYDNPLATVDCSHSRSDWFKVFCCPSNICRTLNSLGGYLYGLDESDKAVRLTVHTYVGGTVRAGKTLWKVETEWPWSGKTTFSVTENSEEKTILRLRIPGWAKQHEITVNGQATNAEMQDGYISLPARTYNTQDFVEFTVPMAPQKLESHPLVHQNRNCITLRRGPFIYAIESVDQDPALKDLRLARIDPSAKIEDFEMDINGKSMVALKTRGWALKVPQNPRSSRDEADHEKDDGVSVDLKFIPYFAWGNRGPSDMRVWIQKAGDPSR